MRFVTIAFLLQAALSVVSAEREYPHWYGEPIEEYAQKIGLPATKTIDLGNGVSMEFVLIPAGKFVMGTYYEDPMIGFFLVYLPGMVLLVMMGLMISPALRKRRWPQFSLRWLLLLVAVLGVAQYGAIRYWRAEQAQKKNWGDENPAHEVTISSPYFIGKFEVTQEQYQSIMGSNPSQYKGCDLPVERVSWDHAHAFCTKLGERTSESVRLPSEAEWEYACRAGTRTRFHSGDTDDDLKSAAWYDANSGDKTHPVGEKAPNAWGVYDMHGNAAEWCADWFGRYGAAAARDPQGPANGEARVFRSGHGFAGDPEVCRSAFRGESVPGDRSAIIGFRVVVAVPKKP